MFAHHELAIGPVRPKREALGAPRQIDIDGTAVLVAKRIRLVET